MILYFTVNLENTTSNFINPLFHLLISNSRKFKVNKNKSPKVFVARSKRFDPLFVQLLPLISLNNWLPNTRVCFLVWLCINAYRIDYYITLPRKIEITSSSSCICKIQLRFLSPYVVWRRARCNCGELSLR